MAKPVQSKFLKNQVVRFIFSAGMGFLVDLLAFHLFHNYLFNKPTYQVFDYTVDNYSLSLTISFFIGVVVNFLITRYMVFNESVSSPAKQFSRFSALSLLLVFFANLAILNFFIRYRGHVPATGAYRQRHSACFFASFFVHKVFFI
jgi:putative flippase GtrA